MKYYLFYKPRLPVTDGILKELFLKNLFYYPFQEMQVEPYIPHAQRPALFVLPPQLQRGMSGNFVSVFLMAAAGNMFRPALKN